MPRQLIVFFFLALISCGKTNGYPEEFEQYVVNFQKDTGKVVDTPISFADLEGGVVGICYHYTNGNKKIEIDRKYWKESETNQAKEYIRESLIYHELGHCVLEQDHREELTSHPRYWYLFPNSVMYPYLIGGQDFYSDFRDHYIKELVSPGLKLEY